MTAVRDEWPGAVELEVTAGGVTLPALAYPALTGRPRVGDRVLLNATALELGLGTGGYALVAAVPERLPDGTAGPGHLGKARYTPLQATVLGADERGSPYRGARGRGRPGRDAGEWSPTCTRPYRRSWPGCARTAATPRWPT